MRDTPRSRRMAQGGGAQPPQPPAEPKSEPALRHVPDPTPAAQAVAREQLAELSADADSYFTSLHAFISQELDYVDADDRRTRAVLSFELGHLDEVVLRDPERALGHYELAFRCDPAFVPALRALGRHYGAAGRWHEQLEVLEAEIAATGKDEQRATLLTSMGELRWRRMSDAEGAVENLRAALAIAPRSRRALELLRGVYARREDWQELVDVLRQLCNITADPVERSRLSVEMAEAVEFRQQRAAEAEELYAHALELDPANEKAAVALRRLCLANSHWQQLSDLLATEAGREHEPDEMFGDIYRAARIAEVHLKDDARAASLLETAAALRPADPLPLTALGELYRRNGRHEEQAAVLGRLLRLVRHPQDRAQLRYRLGRLLEDWLGRPQQAAEVYREALADQADHEGALRALANLYQRLEQWAELLEIELLRAERSRDVERRAEGYVRAGELCERRLADVRRAVDLYDRAWRMQPGLSAAFRALDRIYRATGQWEALADLCERRAELTGDLPLAASLLRTAAAIHEERLENPQRAIATLEKLREARPGDREALMHLARLYENAGRVDQLRRALAEWAEVTEDQQERRELLRRIADLLEGPLRKTEAAVDIYRQILADVSEDRAARERLKAIFERTGRWSDLVETLAGELPSTPAGSARAGLQLAIGRICEDKLGDRERAVAAYQAALAEDPRFTPASLALEDSLERNEMWERLAQHLAGEAVQLRSPGQVVAALCRAGEIYEDRLQQAQQAERMFHRAMELDASSAPVRHGLERLYLAAGERNALESHYLREAENANNPVLRVRAYLRLATLFDGPGEDPVGAAAAYESALKVAEDQPDALHGLASLCRRTAQWDRYANLLGRIAASANDAAVAVAALQEWASIVEVHQRDRWDPEPIYQRVLDADPLDTHAIVALERLAYAQLDEAALYGLAVRQAKVADDPLWIASLCVRAATVLVIAGKPQDAAEVLRRGLEAEPAYLPAVRMLRRLAEQTEQWQEAATLLLQEGELATRPEARQQALTRAGNILLDRFGDRAAARAALERVFTEDPTHAAAFGRLVEILAAERAYGELVDLYQRRMSAVDPAERAPLQLQLATVFRDSIGNNAAAIDVLAELLETQPEHEQALSQIAELCATEGRWREAEEWLRRLADAAEELSSQRRDALLRRAEILDGRLGEEDAALEVLRQLLAAEPAEREALGRCMRIYRRRGDWERAVEVLDELTRSGDPVDRVDGLVDLAEIHSRTLNDPERARAALRRAAAVCVEGGAGIDRVSEYFERRGDFEGLVALWGEVLDNLPPEGSPGAVAVRLARSRVLAGRLLRPEEAEAEILKALQGEPTSREARLELAGLHLWGDNLADALTEYNKILDQDPFCADGYRGLFRVYDRRNDLDRAAGAAQAVCAVGTPDDAEANVAAQATMAVRAALPAAAETPLGIESYWRLLAHADEPQPARELLRAVADYLPQIFAEDVARVADGAVIPLEDEEPLAARCLLLSRALGVSRLECCVGQQRQQPAEVLPGQMPRLVVEEAFARDAEDATFRFVVGRAVADVLARSFYLAVIPSRSVELLLAAVVELFERGFGDYIAAPGELDDLSRRMTRAIPRKVRRTLEEPARTYAAGGPVAAARWQVATRRSCERAGLLLCGDVKAAVDRLIQEGASRSVRADLLRFAVSPHLYEARRRLGLSAG